MSRALTRTPTSSASPLCRHEYASRPDAVAGCGTAVRGDNAGDRRLPDCSPHRTLSGRRCSRTQVSLYAMRTSRWAFVGPATGALTGAPVADLRGILAGHGRHRHLHVAYSPFLTRAPADDRLNHKIRLTETQTAYCTRRGVAVIGSEAWWAMRVAVGGIWQETNTFVPSATTLEDFRRYQLFEGGELLDALRGTGSELGGAIDVADQAGITLVPLLFGAALPSGTVQRAAFETMMNRLVERLALGIGGGCGGARGSRRDGGGRVRRPRIHAGASGAGRGGGHPDRGDARLSRQPGR